MKNDLFYCKKWSNGYKEAIGIMSVDAAKKLHIRGMPYTVLVGSDTQPTCYIEMLADKKMIGVGFLDAQLKEYLMYQFQMVKSGDFFLSMAVHREFSESNEGGVGIHGVTRGTSYLFKEDGHVNIKEENFTPYSIEESKSLMDVSGNYESTPEFGEYQSLIKVER